MLRIVINGTGMMVVRSACMIAPGLHALLASSLFDSLTLFRLSMLTLVNLCALFWVGTRLWLALVLRRAVPASTGQRFAYEQGQQNFERWVSPLVLALLCFANAGLLAGQAFHLNAFWLVSESMALGALLLWGTTRLFRRPSRSAKTVFASANLAMGLAQLLALAGSSLTVRGSAFVFALVGGWLQLLAATLSIGGAMCMAVIYLPLLRRTSAMERVRSLTSVLSYSAPFTLVGMSILALSIPLSAVTQPASLTQAVIVTYEFEMALLAGLLLISVFLLRTLRPRLNRELTKYVYVAQRVQREQAREKSKPVMKLLSQQVKQRENRLAHNVRQAAVAARWLAITGVAVVFCVSLTTVFANTPASVVAVPQPQTTRIAIKPFTAGLMTTDKQFSVTLTVTPNHFGPNVFMVSAIDTKTGARATTIQVSLSLTMLDMNMGTAILTLQADREGQFSGRGNISMTGNWEIQILIRTADAVIHEAQVRLLTPF